MYRRTETNNYFVVFLSSPQNQPKGLFHHFCQKLDLDIYLKITEKSNTNQLKQFQGFDINSYYCYLLLFLLEFENLELIVDLSFIKKCFRIPSSKTFYSFYDFLQNKFHQRNLQGLHPYQDLYNRYNLFPRQPLKMIIPSDIIQTSVKLENDFESNLVFKWVSTKIVKHVIGIPCGFKKLVYQ